MHKQRSPFTTGPQGFGASAFNFNAPQFGEGGVGGAFSPSGSEGLNGMPFLNHKPMISSISRQRALAEEAGLESLPPALMAQRILAAGRGGVVPGAAHGMIGRAVPNFYGNYEGDNTMMSHLEDKNSKISTSLMMQSKSSPNQIPKRDKPVPVFPGDTDSETDLCMQMKDAEAEGDSRWRRAFNCLLAALPEQRRRRWEAGFQSCSESVIAKHLLLVLHLLVLLLGQAKHLGTLMVGLKARLWRLKFQVRTTMRQMLWRLANLKGNDTLIFLFIVLATPWLFLISLVGFGISFIFSMKTGLAEGLRLVRKRMR
ncbi:hypothetical protein KR009_010336 [Drosophila setifemur]|nr:hypothetical protein KR009_010336 [Drosophila setifemur]